MIRAGLFSLLLATPAAAFDIDFEQVFADHAAEATRTGDTTRRLDLPGPVTVIETTLSDGSHIYFARDGSQQGAAGCTFSILIEVTAAALSCPGLVDAARADALAENPARSASFVAANTVPPVPEDRIPDLLQQRIADRTAAFLRTGMTCPDPSSANGLMPVVRTATNPAFAALLDRLHETPRLPVALPCM